MVCDISPACSWSATRRCASLSTSTFARSRRPTTKTSLSRNGAIACDRASSARAVASPKRAKGTSTKTKRFMIDLQWGDRVRCSAGQLQLVADLELGNTLKSSRPGRRQGRGRAVHFVVEKLAGRGIDRHWRLGDRLQARRQRAVVIGGIKANCLDVLHHVETSLDPGRNVESRADRGYKAR